jgi:hypothetical protein
MEVLDPEINFIFSIKESNWKNVYFILLIIYFYNY